ALSFYGKVMLDCFDDAKMLSMDDSRLPKGADGHPQHAIGLRQADQGAVPGKLCDAQMKTAIQRSRLVILHLGELMDVVGHAAQLGDIQAAGMSTCEPRSQALHHFSHQVGLADTGGIQTVDKNSQM